MNHRSKKVLVSVLVCIACILTGLVLVVSIDAPPPQDADLLLFYCPPPEERNGYIILQKAGELLTGQEEIEALAASAQPDPAAINRLLVANEAALREVERATAAPHFDRSLGYDASPISSPISLQRLIELIELKGLADLWQGRANDALNVGISLVRLGYSLERAGRLIDCLLGRICKHQGLDLIEAAIETGIHPSHAAKAAMSLSSLMDSRDGYAKAIRLEYMHLKGFVCAFAQGDLHQYGGRYEIEGFDNLKYKVLVHFGAFFKKNATLRACAEHYRAELARLEGKGAPDPKERSRPRPSLWSGNIFGQAIVALMIPSFERQYASVTALEERARQVLASLQRLSSRPNHS